MKKLLTTALAFVLSILTLGFVACAPAETPDPTYNGNYTEVTAQELYASSKNTDTKWGLPAPSETLKTQTYGSYSYTSESTDYLIHDEYYFSEISSIYNDNGTYKQNAIVTLVESTYSESADYKGGYTTTRVVYIKDSKYYMNVKSSFDIAGEKSEYEYRYQTDYTEYNNAYQQVVQYVKPQNKSVPKNEADFADFVALINASGIKLLADLSNGELKVKVDLENQELSEDFFREKYDLEGFTVSPTKLSACYVFDTNKLLKAYKFETKVRFTSPYGILAYENNFETKGYDGAISFPNDLDTYISII